MLYLNDGQNLFDPCTSIFGDAEWRVDETVSALLEQGGIAPLIVVGIDNGGRRLRAKEYLPWKDETLQPPEEDPQGSLYPRFLLDEVVSSSRTGTAHWRAQSIGPWAVRHMGPELHYIRRSDAKGRSAG